LESDNEKLKTQLEEANERVSKLEKTVEETKSAPVVEEPKKRKSKKKTEETLEEQGIN
jgi:nicotinic acid mononucleotide adenylyltransferase